MAGTRKLPPAVLAALHLADKALREAEEPGQKKAVRDWCRNSHLAQNAIMDIAAVLRAHGEE